jgi:hypothetical protein
MIYSDHIGFCLSVAFSIGMLLGAGIAWMLVMHWEPIHAEEKEIM